MKRKIGIVGSILAITILFSCNNGSENSKNTSDKDSTLAENIISGDSLSNSDRKASTQSPLETEINKLHSAMALKDITTINSFIEAEKGLLVIPATGAMLQFNTYASLNETHKNLFSALTHNEDLTFSYESLPTPDCDSENLYSKTGSFILERNESNEDNLQIYREADESWKKNILSLVTHTLVNTNDYTYFFNYKEGKLTLLAINFRRPCNA